MSKQSLDEILTAPDDEAMEGDPRAGRCTRPGPRGCGVCGDCVDWGDYEYHRRVDAKIEKEELK